MLAILKTPTAIAIMIKVTEVMKLMQVMMVMVVMRR